MRAQDIIEENINHYGPHHRSGGKRGAITDAAFAVSGAAGVVIPIIFCKPLIFFGIAPTFIALGSITMRAVQEAHFTNCRPTYCLPPTLAELKQIEEDKIASEGMINDDFDSVFDQTSANGWLRNIARGLGDSCWITHLFVLCYEVKRSQKGFCDPGIRAGNQFCFPSKEYLISDNADIARENKSTVPKPFTIAQPAATPKMQ